MKTKLLLIVLCLACTASFAQKKKPKNRPRSKPAAQQPVQTPPPAPSTALSAQPPIDTSKKKLASKPFDRPLDGYYRKSDILNARPVPYANIREADVAFEKRVWRDIDIRDKMNTYMASPKQRLIDVLLTAIANGELTAYDATPDAKIDPDGDSFGKTLTPSEAYSKMVDSVTVDKTDANGNSNKSRVANILNPDSVVKFRLKEDWIFDRQRSVFEPRIIGIAPLVKPTATGDLNVDYQPAFWIYFPDARPILATKEVVNKNSDATGLSYDDVFLKRMFASYITKQSNDKDEKIKDYAQGIDRLYEAERIKKNMMDWELNLWQY
jgi:gliding motility associated protien GldN